MENEKNEFLEAVNKELDVELAIEMNEKFGMSLVIESGRITDVLFQ